MFWFSSSLAGFLPYLAPAWLGLIVAGLAMHIGVTCKSSLPRVITDFMEYGKLRKIRPGGAAGFLGCLNLPKKWFTHFYVWGTFWIISVTTVYFCRCVPIPYLGYVEIPILDDIIAMTTGGLFQQKCNAYYSQQHIDAAVVLGMLSVQVTRRLYECLFISVFSDAAKIHVGHYLLGLFFYPAAALTALLHLHPINSKDSSSPSVFPFLRWYHIVASILFIWGSYHQNKCHKILAGLRKNTERGGASDTTHPTQRYSRPDGDWFELVSCPHFLAEIVIYISLLLCLVVSDLCTCWWLVVVYVVSTLSLSARQAHLWYKEKFEDYPPHRYAIIPRLL